MIILALLGVFCCTHSLPIQRRDVTVRNDLLDGPCKAITVIFARGTAELGNIGAVVGPFLENTLDARLGSNIAFQGVDYPATVGGYLDGGSPEGADTLASLVDTAATKCPASQIVLSGYRSASSTLLSKLTLYSQGAQVIYKGAAKLSEDLAVKVKAAVFFGNPDNGELVPNINNANAKTYCHDGDLICDGQPIVLAPHLTYGIDARSAADFIAEKVSL